MVCHNQPQDAPARDITRRKGWWTSLEEEAYRGFAAPTGARGEFADWPKPHGRSPTQDNARPLLAVQGVRP
jgi:hypothetical protein